MALSVARNPCASLSSLLRSVGLQHELATDKPIGVFRIAVDYPTMEGKNFLLKPILPRTTADSSSDHCLPSRQLADRRCYGHDAIPMDNVCDSIQSDPLRDVVLLQVVWQSTLDLNETTTATRATTQAHCMNCGSTWSIR